MLRAALLPDPIPRESGSIKYLITTEIEVVVFAFHKVACKRACHEKKLYFKSPLDVEKVAGNVQVWMWKLLVN